MILVGFCLQIGKTPTYPVMHPSSLRDSNQPMLPADLMPLASVQRAVCRAKSVIFSNSEPVCSACARQYEQYS